ncbi:hypothetical protein [uncultured Helicobacter sp.]|uniref:hypothetical protein n=1 Tax=uncultured Helicobacter sp. TaxID=175537 RepID=UPI002616FC29|nr:hypothetical protein [uncultured Helicobacter sp.]
MDSRFCASVLESTLPPLPRLLAMTKKGVKCKKWILNQHAGGRLLRAFARFCGAGAGIYLSGNDYSQNHAINPHCLPKTESLQNSAVFFYHKNRIIPPLRLP